MGCDPTPPAGLGRSEWLLAELRRPEAYAAPVAEVEVRRTLVSLLLFAGDRVYKLKQAVDLGYIDATTLERRRALCEEEVRLNAPLAPGVHLGVVPIRRGADGRLVVGGEAGEIVEYAVEMVRLPEESMLARLLERGEIDNEPMNALAELLSAFHRSAATGAGVDEFGTPAGIEVNVEENFRQLAPFVHSAEEAAAAGFAVISKAQHAFLRDRAREFLERQRELLQRRVATGRIREGHGDLHAGNVCLLPERVVIYDRIEFNRRFRCLDVANDIAFLAMDLDFRGYPGFASYFAWRYREIAGDPELSQLVDFYKGYRAIVRAKVAALQGGAGDMARAAREALRAESMRYVHLAVGYELRPTLILLMGLPASGKTFLAERVAHPLRAALFHSDERRKRLSGVRAGTRAGGEWGRGLYALESRQLTYRSLLADATRTLAAGRSAIVDATFTRREFRRIFVDAAERMGVPYCFLCVRAPEATVRERMAARARAGGASDADFEVYLRERDAFEPPDEVPAGHVVTVDSGAQTPEECVSALLDGRIALERRR